MILRKGYHTSVEDFNKDGRLTPLAVLKIFENIGNRHWIKIAVRIIGMYTVETKIINVVFFQ